MDRHGRFRYPLGHVRRDAGGREEQGLAGVVPGFEAEDAAHGHDLNGGQCDGPGAGVDDGDGELGAFDLRLDESGFVVGVSIHHGAGEARRCVDNGDTLGRAALGGLDDQWCAERGHEVLENAGGAEVTECLTRERDPGRGGVAGATYEFLGGGLGPGQPRRGTAWAHVRDSGGLEQGEQGAVFARRTVQYGPNDVGLAGGQLGEEPGLRVEHGHAVPEPGQLIGHTTSAAHGDVALVRDSTREHHNVKKL